MLHVTPRRMLEDLESLLFIPTQQNYDSLSTFLEPVQTTTLAGTASKARLLAKLQHNVEWVQQHVQAQDSISSLCQSASSMAGTNTEPDATAG